MKYLNDIPVFLASAEDTECTITCISLVDDPAMELPMFCFSKEDEMKKYTFSEESDHCIISCIVRTDYPILRRTSDGDFYYIVFNRETSKTLAQKLMSDGYQNNVSLDHDGHLISGIQLQQVFLKDSERGISPKGYDDAADGSLFGVYHITDENLWQQCLNGTFGGVSLESYLILETFKKVENKDTINNNTSFMQKIKMFRTLLKDLLMSFNNLSTDKAELYWNEDTELMVGYSVYVEDENENKIPAPDGEYVSDNNVIVVADGKVTEIKEKEEKPEPEPEPEPEPVVEEPAEEKMEEVTPTEEIVEEEVPAKDNPAQEKEDDNEKIAELETRIADLEKKLADLESKIIEISTTPAAEPIVDEFEQVTKTVSTGDKKLDKRIAIARALRD